MFSLIYAWINDWVNNREAGDLRRQHGHYDVIVMRLHRDYMDSRMFDVVSVKQPQWRHNGRDSASNHQSSHCLLNSLFKRRSKKTPKLRVTGLCAGNSPVTGEFLAQMASNADNVSIWWRHQTWKIMSKCTTPAIFKPVCLLRDLCYLSVVTSGVLFVKVVIYIRLLLGKSLYWHTVKPLILAAPNSKT